MRVPARAPELRFDFAAADGERRQLQFADPISVEAAYRLEDVEGVFNRVEAERQRGRFAAGFVSYEAAPAFDRALVSHEPVPGLPLVWFGIFDGVKETARENGVQRPQDAASVTPAWTADTDRASFDRDVTSIREAIARGDTYQVNYTFRLSASVDPGRTQALYQLLSDHHRPSYGAVVDLGDWQVLSLSPELFFRIKGGTIVSRPMKGTAPRGLWPEDDDEERARLLSSGKNRSENVMIVDLVRNDITRVAEIGSVQASSLFDVAPYTAVWQMTSTVEGTLRRGVTTFDVFRALFPAGSITGAPKSSAMRAIRLLERSPRGVYTGAVGYLTPDGQAAFNVAIRTLTIDCRSGRARAGIGGGVTWESTAASEYAEAASKATFLDPPRDFELFETMRLEAGTVVRLDRHLARLADSAAFLNFNWSEERVRLEVAGCASRRAGGIHRIRLRLSRSGDVGVDVAAMDPRPDNPVVVLARSPVSSRDWTLFHKTTMRGVYDKARDDRGDAFDVLLWNERRELTEFTIGNLVVEIDNARYTPPCRSGLLAGVFRGELLAAGAVTERVITIDDLPRVDRLWLVNSLREWVELKKPGLRDKYGDPVS